MEELINKDIAIKLNQRGYLLNIETKNTFIIGYKTYKTLDLKELIEFLPESINGYSIVRYKSDNRYVCAIQYHPKEERTNEGYLKVFYQRESQFFGISEIEAIEKMIIYLLKNNLLIK